MNENKKFLEGCEKLQDGRYRIRENIQVIPIKFKGIVNEKIMVEGKEVKPKRKYTFLIWNNDFNGNGRNYKNVIPRVIKENRPTFTLADHPSDGEEADSTRICGCGKNYRIINGWLATDWYPLGELGNRIADGFDLGVPSLVSSSVLGGLDDEGYVIDNDSFYLERICDILLDFPSNGIYHYQDHVDKIDDNYHFENISEEGLNESLTILNKSETKKSKLKESDNKGDDIMSENTNDELIQQSMILNIKSMIKDADKMDSPFDKKEALASADEFAKKLDDDSIHVEICKKIETVDAEIKELSDKGLQTDDLAKKVKALEDENTEIKAQLDSANEEKTKLENKLKTLTDMYDEEQYKASETELEKTAELEEKNRILIKRMTTLKARNMMMEKNSRVLESKLKRAEADANTKVEAEDLVQYTDKIKKLEDEVAELKLKLKKATFGLKKATDNLDDVNDELEQVKKAKKVSDAVDVEVGAEEIVALKEKLNEVNSKNMRLRKMINDMRRTEMKKASRFSQLRKSMDEDDEIAVTNDVVESDEIADNEVVVTDNGIAVERDEDDIMEKMLNGQIK